MPSTLINLSGLFIKKRIQRLNSPCLHCWLVANICKEYIRLKDYPKDEIQQVGNDILYTKAEKS